MKIEQARLLELLVQSLEHEMGGVKVYQTALQCVVNADLKDEWEKYLEQTQRHVMILRALFQELGLDPEQETSGRNVVRHVGESLVAAMQLALAEGRADAAQLVACECVLFAETKDHQNWQLLSMVGKKMKGDEGRAIKFVADKVEDEEDEHLYHTRGWTRELWIESLGMKAVLPPPEEERAVHSAIAAARAEAARDKML